MPDVLDQIKRDSAATTARVRELLKDHPQQLAEFDASMEDLETGEPHRRAVWNALSPPQRRLMEQLDGGRRTLVRSAGSRHRYDARGEPHAVREIAGATTVAALVARGLLYWTGGADETLKAEVTEKGRRLRATKLRTN